MIRLWAQSATAVALLCAAAFAHAQMLPPPLPSLTPEQLDELKQRVDTYRRETDERVSRAEITPDEAERLVRWREWQFAQQVAGGAPVVYDDAPHDYYEPRPRDYVVVEPPPYYAPYYRYPAPYYWAPYSYWGPSVCAGGFGHHFGGRICF